MKIGFKVMVIGHVKEATIENKLFSPKSQIHETPQEKYNCLALCIISDPINENRVTNENGAKQF